MKDALLDLLSLKRKAFKKNDNISEYSVIQCPEKEEYFELIKKLCAVKRTVGYELVRAGQKYDGGYIMLNDFRNSDIAYSFGIECDVSWDEWIARRGINVYCYDHTIEQLPKRNRRLHFNKIGIAGNDCKENNLLSMETILKKDQHEKKKGIILKMDVEGAEWDFIHSVSFDVLKQFSQIIFELHEITNINNKEFIINALQKINKTHQAIWIHANNGGGVEKAGEILMPRVIEVTYANRNRYVFEPTEYNCPLPIDRPNVKAYKEIELKGWGSIV